MVAQVYLDIHTSPEDGTLIEDEEVPPPQWSGSGVDTRYLTTETYIDGDGERAEEVGHDGKMSDGWM